MLVVDRITIKRGPRIVIDELSLRVDSGEIVGFVGANGCGKSTLLSCIAGVLPPHDGRIEIAGANVWGNAKHRAKARRAIGYVPEAADPPGFLRAEELWALCAASRGVALPRMPASNAASASSASNADDSSSDAYVEALGLDEIASLTLDKMSLGQRRRACLGAAFVGAPSLLVLDEPDNGLDVKRLAALVDLIKAHVATGGATVLASHDAAWLDQLEARRITM